MISKGLVQRISMRFSMKVGDVVRWVSVEGQPVCIVVSEVRHRRHISVVDILSKGVVVPANIQTLKVVNESR